MSTRLSVHFCVRQTPYYSFRRLWTRATVMPWQHRHTSFSPNVSTAKRERSSSTSEEGGVVPPTAAASCLPRGGPAVLQPLRVRTPLPPTTTTASPPSHQTVRSPRSRWNALQRSFAARQAYRGGGPHSPPSPRQSVEPHATVRVEDSRGTTALEVMPQRLAVASLTLRQRLRERTWTTDWTLALTELFLVLSSLPDPNSEEEWHTKEQKQKQKQQDRPLSEQDRAEYVMSHLYWGAGLLPEMTAATTKSRAAGTSPRVPQVWHSTTNSMEEDPFLSPFGLLSACLSALRYSAAQLQEECGYLKALLHQRQSWMDQLQEEGLATEGTTLPREDSYSETPRFPFLFLDILNAARQLLVLLEVLVRRFIQMQLHIFPHSAVPRIRYPRGLPHSPAAATKEAILPGRFTRVHDATYLALEQTAVQLLQFFQQLAVSTALPAAMPSVVLLPRRTQQTLLLLLLDAEALAHASFGQCEMKTTLPPNNIAPEEKRSEELERGSKPVDDSSLHSSSPVVTAWRSLWGTGSTGFWRSFTPSQLRHWLYLCAQAGDVPIGIEISEALLRRRRHRQRQHTNSSASLVETTPLKVSRSASASNDAEQPEVDEGQGGGQLSGMAATTTTTSATHHGAHQELELDSTLLLLCGWNAGLWRQDAAVPPMCLPAVATPTNLKDRLLSVLAPGSVYTAEEVLAAVLRRGWLPSEAALPSPEVWESTLRCLTASTPTALPRKRRVEREVKSAATDHRTPAQQQACLAPKAPVKRIPRKTEGAEHTDDAMPDRRTAVVGTRRFSTPSEVWRRTRNVAGSLALETSALCGSASTSQPNPSTEGSSLTVRRAAVRLSIRLWLALATTAAGTSSSPSLHWSEETAWKAPVAFDGSASPDKNPLAIRWLAQQWSLSDIIVVANVLQDAHMEELQCRRWLVEVARYGVATPHLTCGNAITEDSAEERLPSEESIKEAALQQQHQILHRLLQHGRKRGRKGEGTEMTWLFEIYDHMHLGTLEGRSADHSEKAFIPFPSTSSTSEPLLHSLALSHRHPLPSAAMPHFTPALSCTAAEHLLRWWATVRRCNTIISLDSDFFALGDEVEALLSCWKAALRVLQESQLQHGEIEDPEADERTRQTQSAGALWSGSQSTGVAEQWAQGWLSILRSRIQAFNELRKYIAEDGRRWNGRERWHVEQQGDAVRKGTAISSVRIFSKEKPEAQAEKLVLAAFAKVEEVVEALVALAPWLSAFTVARIVQCATMVFPHHRIQQREQSSENCSTDALPDTTSPRRAADVQRVWKVHSALSGAQCRTLLPYLLPGSAAQLVLLRQIAELEGLSGLEEAVRPLVLQSHHGNATPLGAEWTSSPLGFSTAPTMSATAAESASLAHDPPRVVKDARKRRERDNVQRATATVLVVQKHRSIQSEGQGDVCELKAKKDERNLRTVCSDSRLATREVWTEKCGMASNRSSSGSVTTTMGVATASFLLPPASSQQPFYQRGRVPSHQVSLTSMLHTLVWTLPPNRMSLPSVEPSVPSTSELPTSSTTSTESISVSGVFYSSPLMEAAARERAWLFELVNLRQWDRALQAWVQTQSNNNDRSSVTQWASSSTVYTNGLAAHALRLLVTDPLAWWSVGSRLRRQVYLAAVDLDCFAVTRHPSDLSSFSTSAVRTGSSSSGSALVLRLLGEALERGLWRNGLSLFDLAREQTPSLVEQETTSHTHPGQPCGSTTNVRSGNDRAIGETTTLNSSSATSTEAGKHVKVKLEMENEKTESGDVCVRRDMADTNLSSGLSEALDLSTIHQRGSVRPEVATIVRALHSGWVQKTLETRAMATAVLAGKQGQWAAVLAALRSAGEETGQHSSWAAEATSPTGSPSFLEQWPLNLQRLIQFAAEQVAKQRAERRREGDRQSLASPPAAQGASAVERSPSSLSPATLEEMPVKKPPSLFRGLTPLPPPRSPATTTADANGRMMKDSEEDSDSNSANSSENLATSSLEHTALVSDADPSSSVMGTNASTLQRPAHLYLHTPISLSLRRRQRRVGQRVFEQFRRGEWEAGLHAFQAALRQGLLAYEDVATLIASALRGSPQQQQQHMREDSSHPTVEGPTKAPAATSRRSVVEAKAVGCPSWEVALECFQFLCQRARPDVYSAMVAMEACARGEQWALGLRVLRQSLFTQSRPPPRLFSLALQTTLKCGQWGVALQTARGLQQAVVRHPDVVKAMLRVYAALSRWGDVVEYVFSNAMRGPHGVHMDEEVLRLALQASQYATQEYREVAHAVESMASALEDVCQLTGAVLEHVVFVCRSWAESDASTSSIRSGRTVSLYTMVSSPVPV